MEIPVCNTCNSSKPNSYVLVCTECASKINESQTTDTQQLKAKISEEVKRIDDADRYNKVIPWSIIVENLRKLIKSEG